MEKQIAIQKSTRPNSGIKLDGFKVKSLSGSKAHRLVSAIPLLLIVLCALYGAVLTFTSMFCIPFSEPVVYTVLGVCAVVFTLCCLYPKSMLAVYPMALVGVGVTAAVLWKDILRGFDFIKANVIEGINLSMYWNNPAQEYVWHPSYDYYTTLLICLSAVLVCMLICMFTVWRPSLLGIFLTLFPFFEIGAAFGCVPGYFPCLLLFAAITGVFAMRMAGIKNRKAKNGSDFADARRKHVLASAGRPMAGVGLSIVAITIVAAIVSGQYVAGHFNRTAEIAALRSDIKQAFDEFIQSGFSSNDIGLVDGALATVDDRVIKNKQHLTVTVPKLNKTEYLRGYVGSQYTGSEWTELEDYGDNGMWNNFLAAGLYPQDFQSAALSALAQTDRKVGSSYKTVRVASPIINKKYSFVLGASNLREATPFSYVHDSTVLAENGSDYTFGAFMGETGFNRISRSPLFNDPSFKALWTQYSEFVKTQYLQIPDSMYSFKAIYTTIRPRTDIYAYGDWVRKELAKECAYSTEVDRMPRGGDFVENFMFNLKQGYCVHFASAATMMFRAAGIPARYCEGYILNPDKCTKDVYDKATDTYTVNLTDADAHAWVEIYDTAKGWVRYEVTPGFYQDNSGASAEEEEIEKDEPSPEDVLKEWEELGLIDESLEGNNPNQKTNTTYITILDALRIWSICSIIACIVFILGGLLALRRWYSIAKRRRQFRSKKQNHRVRSAYKYFKKVLFFELIQNEDNTPYLAFAAEAAERSAHLDADETRRAMDIFLKLRFSTHEITEDEADYVIRFVNRYAKAVYRDATPVNRWIFATVRNLY